jgi:hypothetical protein
MRHAYKSARLKSTAQLNEYHDARRDSVALQASVPRDIDEDQERLVLNEQLHRSSLRWSLPDWKTLEDVSMYLSDYEGLLVQLLPGSY